MKKPWIIVLIIVLVLLAGGGIYYFLIKPKPNSLPPNGTANTTNWNTYDHTDFTLKYPPDWTVSKTCNFLDSKRHDKDKKDDKLCGPLVLKTSDAKTIEDFIKSANKEFLENPRDVTLRSGLKVKYGLARYGRSLVYEYYLQNGGKIYLFSVQVYDPQFTPVETKQAIQILNTLKFK